MRKKRIVTMFTAAAVTAALLGTTASASTVAYNARANADLFKSDWERTAIYTLASNGVEIGQLVFGFDTDYFDEDYAWSYGTQCDTRAGVRRMNYDEGYNRSSWKTCGNWSKVEVLHKVTHVRYNIEWRADYGDFDPDVIVSHHKN